MGLFIGHDLGTGGDKAVLVDADGHLLATATASLSLARPGPDRAEQNPADFWAAVASCTRARLAQSGCNPADVRGVAFAGQMLALVPLDAALNPVGPAISWLDARADAEAKRLIRRLGGTLIVRALAGTAPTAKDIVPKVWWLRDRTPADWARIRYLTDATGYLVARATGKPSIDPTGAAATGMIDPHTRRWSRFLAAAANYPLDRVPPIYECTETVGGLTDAAAGDLGLRPGTPVIAGIADIHCAAVGSGAVRLGDAHIYLGTSGWFAALLPQPRHVPKAGIVAVAGPAPGSHLLIGENETAGACVAWLARELFSNQTGDEAHAAIDAQAQLSPPGARGLVFAPWLFGERSPVLDHAVRAAFFGLSLEHTRADMVRALYEGVALNMAWTLNAARKAGVAATTVRAIGGGARSPVWLQIIADALDAKVEAVAHPQHAGAIGAALMAAVGAGEIRSVEAIRDRVHVAACYQPDATRHSLYAEHLAILKKAYPALSAASGALQRHGRDDRPHNGP
jgi:xylulokinase